MFPNSKVQASSTASQQNVELSSASAATFFVHEPPANTKETIASIAELSPAMD